MPLLERKERTCAGTSSIKQWIIPRPLHRHTLGRLHIVEKVLKASFAKVSSPPLYSIIVGVVALILTVSMAVPVAPLLVGAIFLRRDRWVETVILSSVGSATGGVILYLIFHHLGWNQIAVAYPDLTLSTAWASASRWVSGYGIWALLLIAAMPFPQTPALIFTAITQLPVSEVFLALIIGKLFKYSIYGFVTAWFPSWFQTVIPIRGHR